MSAVARDHLAPELEHRRLAVAFHEEQSRLVDEISEAIQHHPLRALDVDLDRVGRRCVDVSPADDVDRDRTMIRGCEGGGGGLAPEFVPVHGQRGRYRVIA